MPRHPGSAPARAVPRPVLDCPGRGHGTCPSRAAGRITCLPTDRKIVMLDPLPIARNATAQFGLLPGFANRHGLITGATGTGKTVTLQVLAERFSAIGVPVFMADVKGDLAGMSQPGATSPKLEARVKQIGVDLPKFTGVPVVFWDVFGEQGHPVRATASDLGP